MSHPDAGHTGPGGHLDPPGPGSALVNRVMTRLGRAVSFLREPVVEKISKHEQASAFRVLVATMLSAQTRDPVTDAATRRLFGRARTACTMARLDVHEIERAIYPVSFYRHKARYVKEACAQLCTHHQGRVPASMSELLALPGVGRKTANLVLILAHQSPDNICVDTHVHRISNRLGWVRTTTPEQTERALYRVIPRRWWPRLNHFLVTWGQTVCRPVYPRCQECAIANFCARAGVVRAARSPTPRSLDRE